MFIDKVIKIHNYSKKLSILNNINYEGVILSNGTLLNEKNIKKIKKSKLKLMVSLDGFSESQNYQRVFPNGTGTYDIVKKNLLLSIKKKLIPDISITITAYSAVKLHELIEELLFLNIPFGYNFVRETECTNIIDSEILHQNNQSKFINGILKSFKKIEKNLPNRVFLNSLSDRAMIGILRDRVCGIRDNYFVIDTEGNISQCQMNMKGIVSNINEDDFLNKVREIDLFISDEHMRINDKCSNCKWKYICCSGCPLIRDKTNKSQYCSIYKRILPEILRLEGLRIIKYEKPIICK